MALGRTFVCTGCARAIQAWDEGDPYYVTADGARRYVHHPSPERDRATGAEWAALCLGCGAEVMRDSAVASRPCPVCGVGEVVDAWTLDGRPCPSCRGGTFREDESAEMIS